MSVHECVGGVGCGDESVVSGDSSMASPKALTDTSKLIQSLLLFIVMPIVAEHRSAIC